VQLGFGLVLTVFGVGSGVDIVTPYNATPVQRLHEHGRQQYHNRGLPGDNGQERDPFQYMITTHTHTGQISRGAKLICGKGIAQSRICDDILQSGQNYDKKIAQLSNCTYICSQIAA
jgi:hypothetical protein